MFSQVESVDWEAVYRKMDKDGSNGVSFSELREAICAKGVNVSESVLRTLFSPYDKNKDGTFSLEEFLAIVNKRKMTEDSIRDCFKAMDKDNNGYLTSAELEQAISKTELKCSTETLKKIIAEADKNGDGKISLQEFLRSMNKVG